MKTLSIAQFLRGLPLIAVFLWSCVGNTGEGTLSVDLADAATDQYEAVYVTVDEIQVNESGDDDADENSWITVGTPNATYNLLELVNGVRENLALATLDAGSYSQMRLILGDTPDNSLNILSDAHPYANYVIDLSDEEHELKVPSGMQTGIKIVQGFEISNDETTELVLDFDASASVVIAGSICSSRPSGF